MRQYDIFEEIQYTIDMKTDLMRRHNVVILSDPRSLSPAMLFIFWFAVYDNPALRVLHQV